MEEIEKDYDEKAYVKGFNEGYTLTREMPELAEAMTRALKDDTSDRANGFMSGRDQCLYEKERERRPNWLQDRSYEMLPEPPDKDKQKGMDKDDREILPER